METVPWLRRLVSGLNQETRVRSHDILYLKKKVITFERLCVCVCVKLNNADLLVRAV